MTFRSITAQDLLKEVRASGPGKRTLSSVPGKSSTVSLGQPVKPVKPGLPQLGRGFVPGDDILLESPTKKISSAKSEMLKVFTRISTMACILSVVLTNGNFLEKSH